MSRDPFSGGGTSTPPTFLQRFKNPNLGKDRPPWVNQNRVNNAKKRTAQRSVGGGGSELQMLQDMLGSFGGMGQVDLSSLKAELQKAIAGQYDPQISNLGKSMGQAKKRTAQAKGEIGALYNQLANYYTGQVAPSKARTKQYKADAKQAGDATKQSITQDYANRMQEQINQYKDLGIDAATPSATAGQSAEAANAKAVADMTQNAEQSALDISGQADTNYWNEGAGAAQTEGADQQSALTQQLNAYLNDQNSQMALLEGQKKAAYSQGLMQLQQQAAQSAMQQQNELWNRMLELAKLKNSMASSGGSMPSKGLSGAVAYLGDQNLSNTFQQYLAEANRWGNSAQGKLYYNGGQGPRSPEDWAQVIRDDAANHGLSPDQQLALWQAALKYYGRG